MDSSSAAPCKLFIGGLSAQTTTEVLRGHFSKYGRIIDAVVMSKQGRPRGFGFVTFDIQAGATSALAEPQWLGDRFVDVKRAVPGEQQPVERSPNKIFIGGLPQDATTEDLRCRFASYGPIADAVVMVDRRTKRSRGFGFIRFASGEQGTQAAEEVLKDAANHSLGGKWIEVKRATPADMLQDFSPGSCSTSSPVSTPSHHQTQQHLQQQHWFGSTLPAGMVTPSPQARRLQFSGGPADVYSAHWNAAAFSGFGLSEWELAAADLSPMFTPMRPFAAELSGLDPVSLSAGRLAAAREALQQPSFHLGTDAAAANEAVAGAFETPASSSSYSDGEGEENRPAAANRAMTPPPVRQQAKKPLPPPGLGIEASPMKVEFPSKCFEFEGMSVEAHLKSLTLAADGLGKVQPMGSW